ncbi:hypothetical protein [Xanthomonas citri]|uniref:hypothetical protein n=1 Tax=Xanthomonas citri TaxID=346 RepID=UPI001D051345|nr:hypothetical protein [Xanthomonas axonopodis]
MSIFDADDLVTSTLAPVITIRPEIRTMNRLKKTRYIPANAEAREFPQAGVVAYCYVSGVRYALLAYKGRQIRAALNLAFTTAEQRDRHLTSYIERQTANENAKRERRETGHGLAVGDIVYETYGYEQTNVGFSRHTCENDSQNPISFVKTWSCQIKRRFHRSSTTSSLSSFGTLQLSCGDCARPVGHRG